jgi:hypothetical protein
VCGGRNHHYYSHSSLAWQLFRLPPAEMFSKENRP